MNAGAYDVGLGRAYGKAACSVSFHSRGMATR